MKTTTGKNKANHRILSEELNKTKFKSFPSCHTQPSALHINVENDLRAFSKLS